jgi:transposase
VCRIVRKRIWTGLLFWARSAGTAAGMPREKARITAESFEPGANISAIARHHGVSVGLLHYWRRTVRDRATVQQISLVPLEVEDATTASDAKLEIEIGGARILVRGALDAQLLRTVCEVLRGQ